jgi:uncharacterized protein (TIGR03382 family)
MRPLLAVLLLAPAVAFGQSLVLTVNGSGTSGVLAYNANGCGNKVAGNWVGTSLTTACTSLQIWVTTGTCGSAPSTTLVPADVIVYTLPAGSLTTGGVTTDTFSFAFSSLPSFAVNSCGSVTDFTNQLCGAVTLNDTTGACQGTAVTSTPVQSIRYDNIPPIAPTLSITPLDSQLSVRLTPTDTSDTIQSFLVQYAVQPIDGGTANFISAGSAPLNNPIVTISGLTNGTNYLVQGQSIDEATNVSPPSSPVVATPVLTLGFYANYLGDGGQPGGCGDVAGGGPSALAVAVVLLLGLVRRRG